MPPLRQALPAAGLALLCALPPAFAQGDGQVRPLSYTRLVLPNGLVAIMNEDHSSPLVAVNVTYHVGAKDEPLDKPGLAHLCEHMAFGGSPNVPGNQFKTIIVTGGGVAGRWGITDEDATRFSETVPSNMLETVLWLESDRMAAPFQAVDSAVMRRERTIIRNERSQNVEDKPYGIADPLTEARLYDEAHPYRGALAAPENESRATLDDARQFCVPYYAPNNATLALSGDIDPAKARALVQKYFGTIAKGAPVTHPTMKPAMNGEKRLVLEDSRSSTARLRLAWSGVGFDDPDHPAVGALAKLLLGDPTSGLVRALIFDRALAASVDVAHFDLENGGVFQIEVGPRGPTTLSAIESAVDSVVQSFKTVPRSAANLKRSANAMAFDAMYGLRSRASRAEALAQGQSWTGNPTAYAAQAAAVAKLTPADIQRAAAKYLGSSRVVLSMVPAGKFDLASRPELPYQKFQMAVPAERK